MAIGRSQALTGQDKAAVTIAAPDAGHPEVSIQLTCQTSADGHALICLRGDLDIATVERVVQYVIEVIDRHDGPVTVDLRGVEFCDACGLGALIRIAARAERGDRGFELINPSWALTRIMRITGIERQLLGPAAAAAPTPLTVAAPSPAAGPA
jgi:anti-anti-sigma factor